MSQLCRQAEGGQSQPSSVFLVYSITQWVMPIYIGVINLLYSVHQFKCNLWMRLPKIMLIKYLGTPWPSQVKIEYKINDCVT